MRRIHLRMTSVVCWVLAAAAMIAAPASAFGPDIDEWYVVSMGDQRVGWMHIAERNFGTGIRTVSEIHVEVGRGETNIAIDISSEFVETLDGKPFELVSVQKLGARPITRKFRFEEDRVVATVEQNGSSTIQSLDPVSADWLTPAAARRFVEAKLKEGAPEFSYTIIDSMNGPLPVHVKSTVVGPTTVEAIGKRVPAIELRTEQSASPGVITTEYFSEDGAPVRTEVALGAIELAVVKSEREVALAKIDPAEIMVSAFVTPSRAIANPRGVGSAIYILSVDEGRIEDLPTTSAQRVERLDPQRVRVTVDMTNLAPAEASDAADPKYMLGSAMLNWRDKQIEPFVTAALRGNFRSPAPVMAEQVRNYVHAFISDKSLDVGLASASEVLRTREGDCTEHATLLAAALRYLGIQSRVVGGLIYADSFAGRSRIFGYHMWTQALLPGEDGALRWVDLDATLPSETPFDATHIALTVSAMSDQETINSMATLAPLLGRLKIEVEQTKAKPESARR